MSTFNSKSPTQTQTIAKQIANSLSGGEILALSGDLGVGKTEFTKGLAKYLKIKESITSPTFVLLKPYQTSHKKIKTLVHIDCYRLENTEELFELGLNEYLSDPYTITIIEWADKIKNALPKKNVLYVNLKLGKNKFERSITLKN